VHLLHQGRVKIPCLQHFYHSFLQTPGWMTSSQPLSYLQFLLYSFRLDLTPVLEVIELTSKTVRICHIKTFASIDNPIRQSDVTICLSVCENIATKKGFRTLAFASGFSQE